MLQILAKMESHHATWKIEVQKCCTYMQISFAKSCKYHAIWKGLFSKCRRCHARGSISTMQVDVAECWTYCKCHANSVVCFHFFCLDGFTSFLTSWLCLCPPVHRNQSHKRKEITKTAYSSLHPNKDHNINSCWCVPPATPTPTTTTTATATTRNKITITTTTVLPQLQIQQLQELQQLQLQQK